MAEYKVLDKKVIKLSKQIVQMCTAAGSGHPSSSLALVHITTALMYRIMNYDPENPWNTASDRLVLSEGHAVPVIYAAYCDLGGVVGTPERPSKLRFEDAMTLREADSVLDGHPNPAVGFPFFDAATGSLGQGLSVAAGLAAAARLDGCDKRIYCIIGDGEAREGQISEALDFIIDNKLTNVIPIFSANGQGQSDYVSPQQSVDVLTKKLQAFGYDVKVIDGHNWDDIFDALAAKAKSAPIAVIAKTIKGWGVSEFLSSNYHGKPLPAAKMDQAMADLDAKSEELGVKDASDVPGINVTKPEPIARPTVKSIDAGSFTAALEVLGMKDALDKKKLSTRRAYGVALAACGAADQRVVATDGDVQGSTFTNIFAQRFPDRYFEAKIAEQNMISFASGLSAGGRVVFASSFAKFLIRACDQIEMASNSCANIKLVGSHSGVSLAADGPSQMGLCDLAFMRSFARSTRPDGAPALHVLCPSDAVSAFKLTELAANTPGMCYIRTHRPDVDFIYEETETFTPGGFKHLIDGEDICIVASGYMVHLAKKACKLLEDAGLSASLVDAYAMPLKTEEILRIGDDCRGQILVVEDNYVGAFGDEIASAAACSDLGVTVRCMNVQRVPKSAKTPEDIIKMVNLTPTDIAKTAQQMFDKSE
ncbi:MAG: transketolase [Sedimentisphaerales bacterium]|nr:transketolase [Sedimentisphaerales bacterium]